MEMDQVTVYVVWTLEDCDNVSIHLNKEDAEEEYESLGEFARWEAKAFSVNLAGEWEEDDDAGYF
jgi:hypothetical protein